VSERLVWPYVFTLRAAELLDAYQAAATQRLAPLEVAPAPVEELGIPTALRWLTVPELGIPRRPFSVYRRRRGNIPSAYVRTLVSSPVTLNGQLVDLPFPATPGGLIYLASVQIQPTAGQSISVSAYDQYGNAIPGQSVTTGWSASPLLTGPGMAGIWVSGSGQLGPVIGVGQDDYANLPDWQLTQIVGLPSHKGELGADYDSAEPQGYVAAHLDGYAAAEQRLRIAHLLGGTPPDTGDPQFPLPPWPRSSPVGYLDNLRSAGNLFGMIGDCLAASVDSDPARMQSLYTEQVTLDGIKQANLPGATANANQTSTAGIPVVATAMLGVSTDSDAATALGYGTIDLPGLAAEPKVAFVAEHRLDRAVAPASVGLEGFDYMVSAPYVLPLGLEVTLAALSQPAPAVAPAYDLGAAIAQLHAVLARDTTAQVAVELTWQPPDNPQGYALLASRTPFTSVVLNTARPASVQGYDPYVGLVPTNPDPSQPPDEQPADFKDAAGQLPIDGSATTRYLAAGLDVFGQWSAWDEADITLSAMPVAQPGLRNVSLVLGGLPTSGKTVAAQLVIEVIWDWTDRSPGSVRITGQFVPPGSSLGPAYLSGLAMGNTLPVGAPLLLSWDYGATDPATVDPGAVLPTLDAWHSGTVELITDVSGVSDNQVMQYRITLDGLTLDFSADDELDIALYATATERVRPGEWSDPQIAGTPYYIGRIVKGLNPFPPTVVFAPPAISWTALPDAYNRARGMLEWTSDPSAAGYMVWESTEGALLQLLSPGSPDPDPNASLVSRGATLKTLVGNNYDQSLQSFSRLNTDPIQGSRTEIDLPGNASTLYAYMISAVSPQGVEAARSSQIAVFGVPQRVVPGQPRLMLRELPIGSTGIQVIGLAVETGAVPAGYRVLRVRSATLAQEPDLMGPPKILETAPGWTPYTDTPLHGGTTASGQSVIDAAATPSWYPYYYRVVAVGPDDPPNGKYRGESLPSAVQLGYCLPPNPPLLQINSPTEGSGAALLLASVDLPIPASPLAPALVELLHAEADPANPGRTVQQTVLSMAPDAITEGTLSLPRRLHLPPRRPGAPPWMPPAPFVGPAFARSTSDGTGTWTLYVLVPYTAADVNTYTVRLTDPLNRQSIGTF
jgi:hypothetical protein